ncbi:RNA-binding region-containing protein 3-like isoform X1 [Montipora capricornis]|uniref:RNA-binding region-containing protein 3-like isoform X1 n=1 Tax=Montipora capricornis TaxID=246305 RepID=UPI0035F1EC9C
MADCRSSKLLVRHLPSKLNVNDKIDLLKHFGAKDVICMERRGKMRDAAFVEFPSQAEAAQALSQLHQIEVLGSRLTVEYAKPYHEHLAARQCSRISPQTEFDDDDVKNGKEPKKPDSEQSSKEKVKSSLQGLAPGLGIHYIANPSLSYMYPPANATILTNIAHTLACVPRFYIQVLHLMNKMNLPAPFGQRTPTPPLLSDSTGERQVTAVSSDDDKSMSSEESEIESDEEEREKRAKKRAENIQRMSVAKPAAGSKKRHKVVLHPAQPPSKKVRPASSSKLTTIDKAFEQPTGQPKKIEFKLMDTNIFDSGASDTVAASNANPLEAEGFGRFAPPAEETDACRPDNEEEEGELLSEESDEFVTSSELRRNRVSSKEMSEISAFKNYIEGEPTCRLYIKNLAKHVDEKDLKYVFGRYIDHSIEDEKNRFDIRLMKEGRMKGQAFITLPSEAKAKKALRDAHGYILHGKPMVIQFARSAKAKEKT